MTSSLFYNFNKNLFFQSDKELEALIGRTVKGNWQLLDKHGAGSFLLNPDECDDKDVDKDDYCTFEVRDLSC